MKLKNWKKILTHRSINVKKESQKNMNILKFKDIYFLVHTIFVALVNGQNMDKCVKKFRTFLRKSQNKENRLQSQKPNSTRFVSPNLLKKCSQ